ncbi:MAG: hypothetical protein ACRDH8_00910 [Actinomycetota bacterium]
MDRRLVGIAATVVLTLGAWPAGSATAGTCPVTLPKGSEPVTLDPADFVDQITNPYWPMAPGTRWVYRETDTEGNKQRVEVTVLRRRKPITGINATVVHDEVTEHGELVENTYDWYAQDECGNVWYMGERTKEFENGRVTTTAGSWEHGVDGALAGVIMPGDPQPGLAYRQEYYAGEAEDAGQVMSLDEQAQVPRGHFRDVLLTKDFTPLQPKVLEYKFYAKGVGPVLVLGVSGGSDREDLIRFRTP